MEDAAGLYGKLPSNRDFLRRGLPNRFVLPWDDWLAHMLAASKTLVGEAWLEAYLSSPPWRFALDPGLFSEDGWLGVVVSSVDALDRCFPLTLATSSHAAFTDLGRLFACESWMVQTETLALALLDGRGSLDESLAHFKVLASQVQVLGLGPPVHGDAAGGASEAIWAQAHELAEPAAEVGRSLPQTDSLSYWWHGDWPGHPAIALRCRGLPDIAASASFFDASWFERGLVQMPHPKSP
ncbi:MAG: type VI secretion system-associated protein TagF [Beijerinckiaceae bacterium]